uniref:Uncharacterized protein n=1 Tax=Ananas comosus var. bracteatus TaxID=296719 RepID=A0A6V7NZZ0_ANACO|nr:unnamed protein product [Ananas comosus var. bracteatus]
MWNRVHEATYRSRSNREFRSIFLAIVASISVICMLYFHVIESTKPSSQIASHELTQPQTLASAIHLVPSVEFTNGTVAMWRIPDSPKAAVFVAHGCNCRAANFWDKSPSCPDCVGLPEDRAIVLRALSRRFAVLTISSAGKCWSVRKDFRNVKWIIERWVAKYKLEKLPLTALGASSGGYFVSALAAEVRFSSIALMIAEGVFGSTDMPVGYPPTLFVHMPKDSRRAKLIEMNMELLRKKGVRVKEIRCLESPLTPTLLSERIPGLNEEFSVELYELFQEKGFVDEKGFMRKDGRVTRWKQAAEERGLLSGKYEWVDHIQEELNLAYGYHEMTSLQADDILEWFEVNMD